MPAGMSNKHTVFGILAFGMVAAFAGCAAGRNTAQGAGDLATDTAEGASRFTRDRSITFAVKTAMIDDELVEADDIDVDTSSGVVTLNGSQPSEAARQRALELAWKAEGVTKVVNNLVIAPSH
jgi:hyperosmotically inducible periplasmic protein